jgi:UDP-N-acetylglucosamine 2-epimerase
MSVIVVVDTRPEVINMAPVINELEKKILEKVKFSEYKINNVS